MERIFIFLVGDTNTRHFNTRPQRTSHDYYLSLLHSLVSFLPRSPYMMVRKIIKKAEEKVADALENARGQ